MEKRRMILWPLVAVLLLSCVGCSGDRSPEESAIQTEGTVAPLWTEDPGEEPGQRQKVELLVTRADGTEAQGAAVIATDSKGRQEYATTDEAGLAVLYLTEGSHSLRLLRDGEHSSVELEVAAGPVQQQISLVSDRVLYILLTATGSYQGDPGELAGFSELVQTLRDRYPDAVYLTGEDRYDIEPRDGDAMLSVELFVEHHTDDQRYFASEIRAELRTYQESITAWDMDGPGKEIDTQFVDSNLCSIRVRNGYDHDYINSVAHVTGSVYTVSREQHLMRHSPCSDPWSYGYTMESVPGTSSEQQLPAPGVGMELALFLTDTVQARSRDYASYVEKLLPYVDLWMSGRWNERIVELAALK